MSLRIRILVGFSIISRLGPLTDASLYPVACGYLISRCPSLEPPPHRIVRYLLHQFAYVFVYSRVCIRLRTSVTSIPINSLVPMRVGILSALLPGLLNYLSSIVATVMLPRMYNRNNITARPPHLRPDLQAVLTQLNCGSSTTVWATQVE